MFKRILIPIDLADESSWQRALPIAIDQVRASGGDLYIVSVVPEIPRLPNLPADYGSQMIPYTEEKLGELVSGRVPSEVPVSKLVRQGTVYKEILGVAQEHGCDLIVIASHRPELKDYLLGPNAARVVRHASCSVFVVRD